MLVTVVPSPRPPSARGCERKSPIEAPSGRVRMYASQNASTAFIAKRRWAIAIAAMSPPQMSAETCNRGRLTVT